MSAPARLHPADVEAIAEATAHKLAALLHEGAAPAHTGLLTAAQVAQRFGVTPVWARDHADELGAVRLGDGPRPRLRFDPQRVEEALGGMAARPGSEGPQAPNRPTRRRKRQRQSASEIDGCPLLPVRGEER